MVALNVAAQHRILQRGKLSFSEAIISVIRHGLRARRASWEDHGRWIAFEPGCPCVEAASFQSKANRAYVESIGGTVAVAACLTMQARGAIMLGWTPTSGDLTGEDWYLLEDGERT